MFDRRPPLTPLGLLFLAFGWAANPHASWAQASVEALDDLTELSIESLMDIDVYSVSKSAEPWRQAAAASYVLTAEDIRLSGVRSLPEALRLVPGVTVARVDAHTWAVTSRGFNNSLVDKLEVLMDGRSLYTPLYSGVYWQRHNILMSDIERIEVIRGPGAALWGANAVNGVINIVTRRAQAAPTAMLEAGTGHSVNGHVGGSVRADFANGAARFYGRNENVDDFELRNGENAHDHYRSQRLGFRSDWQSGPDDSFMLSGETYQDELDQPGGAEEAEHAVDYLLGRWRRSVDGRPSLEATAWLKIPCSIFPARCAKTAAALSWR